MSEQQTPGTAQPPAPPEDETIAFISVHEALAIGRRIAVEDAELLRLLAE